MSLWDSGLFVMYIQKVFNTECDTESFKQRIKCVCLCLLQNKSYAVGKQALRLLINQFSFIGWNQGTTTDTDTSLAYKNLIDLLSGVSQYSTKWQLAI